ncbi:class I SAM-dependent methyltransferase [Pirellulaceae bacterium SH501]
MTIKPLLNADELEDSPIVANCTMNRERDLRGSNGYEVEVGFDPLEWLKGRLARQCNVRWLDLCCGSGKALIQAARLIEDSSDCAIEITGVDLVGMFLPTEPSRLRLLKCSLFDYQPTAPFDLITCVHGLHYLGDKLRAIAFSASWLASDGFFVANLDPTNMCLSEAGKGHRRIIRFLRDEGFEYLPDKHLLRCNGRKGLKVPYRFLGADDCVGPNYTRQPAVLSYYESL